MKVAVTPRPRSVRKEFLAIAQAYINFGVSNPSLYRLMFSARGAYSQRILVSERALATMGVVLDLLGRGQQLSSGFRRQRGRLQVKGQTERRSVWKALRTHLSARDRYACHFACLLRSFS
jgi:hypothetical protein